MNKILLSTTNYKKKERIQRLLNKYKIVMPDDLNLKIIEVTEGKDVYKNAELKAQAYFGKTDLPILGYDHGLEIENESLSPALVRRNALKGKNEDLLSKQEIYNLMIKFYTDLAKKHGGEVRARWIDAFSLVDKSGKIHKSVTYRPIIITTEVKGAPNINSPITNIYKVLPINKYVCDLTAEEEFKYRQVMIQKAVLELLSNI